MGNEKIVEKFFTAIEKNDYNTAEGLLSNNFKVTGVGPAPLSAKDFLGLHWAFNKGMPDFKFNLKIDSVKKDVVVSKVSLTGTHTKEMPAPIPALHSIPATNKSLKMPEETITLTVKDDKIESMHLAQVPNGGLPGVLKQLGVELPK